MKPWASDKVFVFVSVSVTWGYLCNFHKIVIVIEGEHALSPPVASGGGILIISREKELSETCMGGCYMVESFISMQLHSWVSKVPFSLVQS